MSSRLADSLGMSTSVRLFYLHIFCYGRTLVWSIFNLFWIKLKDLIRAKRTSVFDL
jgi:hypothetical protein